MANLNLSEFTEKLFVADADHTFIWDTAASISKRVSRNSWLNSGTLTSDAPVTISQTWNNAAVAFTGLKVNAVSTASAAASLLLDLQVGGVSQFSVSKTGSTTFSNGAIFSIAAGCDLATNNVTRSGAISFGPSSDAVILRDGAANTLALRNGANAQTFRVYNTFLGTTANEWFEIDWKTTAGLLRLATTSGGTGVARSMEIIASGQISLTTGSGHPIDFRPAGVTRWTIHTPGNLWATTDNSYDIGASGANRPRNVYVGTAITAGGAISGQNFGSSAGGYFNWATRSNIFSPADGVIRLANDAQTDFNRLQFGGTTNLFPAIKRSTTYLQARLADDSAFAPIQGKLTTDTAYTGTVVAATGYITIYDSTGTAYRVPCAV